MYNTDVPTRVETVSQHSACLKWQLLLPGANDNMQCGIPRCAAAINRFV